MRVLFAASRGAGHVRPLLPVAHACVRAGHDVLLAGHPDVRDTAARAGLPFRAVAAPAPEDVARYQAGRQGLAPHAAAARAFGELFVGLYGHAALPGMVAAIAEWRPDVVVRDSAEIASAAAADAAGVARAEVAIGLSTRLSEQMLQVAAPQIAALFASAGAEAPTALSLTLSASPPSFDDVDPDGATRILRYRTGAARPAGRAGSPQGPPLVLVSFGTEVPAHDREHFPSVYRTVLDALAGEPVRAVLAVGADRDPADLGPAPANVRVERWIDQPALLPDAAAMVCHAGSGTVLDALAAGVPVVGLPFFADQPMNAARVARLGAGVAIGSAAELPVALRTVLACPGYRETALGLAREIAALPPVDEVVDELASVLVG